ncbi:uncharacterized protein AC631_05820 [Debaryomyces fabryi]|uniref:FAD-binding FR-type domain-containing protein n=1 Tax=Debaryomyces fabryi TaxID=58627 RepID=A0A0V1PQG7_9ASCO|nr:uncharacterized protein AC631_05820 [Debaryomyces fabryi]KRZ98420.1 hypothetical protein AC631_05820 [Debaryomyces fabryi]CUM52483.1 unnamed protein product [Debaryomyces fabryi]
MYYTWAYISLIIAILLTPFLIPTNGALALKYRRIKVVLSICLLISILISLTPEKAVEGGPVQKFGQSTIALLGCSFQIMNLGTFCDPSSGVNARECFCVNPNAMSTISYCYMTAHQGQIDSFLKTCKTEFNVTVTRQVFEESFINYTKYARFPDQLDPSNVINYPIKLNDSVILTYKHAYDQFLGNYDRSVYYGGVLLLYWLIVFLLAAIGNWSKLLFPSIVMKMTGKISNVLRQKITLPATGGKKKTNEKPFLKILDMLVPTRAETLIIMGFLALTAHLLQSKIEYIDGDPIFDNKISALLRYTAVRASIISSETIPLLILFGGRNNFLQWLTRWDYSTFITFHRWLSRIIFFLVVIHAICYSVYMGDYFESMHEAYLIWGAIATVSGGFIMIQGLLVLRRRWYEMFLMIHIVLAAVFIGASWVHVNDLYCLWFYYYATAIWVFDRVIRIGRLCSFGFPKAKVILLADETLKIIVPTPEHWESIPGGHAFIHFLTPSCFWQSHPFTYTIAVDDPNKIVLYIKVKEGVTQSMYKYLLQHPGKSTYIRVAIEGSYGESTAASRYDTAVFIAGGNGIPGIYAEVFDLAVRGNDLKQSLKLVWLVREYSSLFWFYEELLALQDTKIETTIYVTRPESHICLEEFNNRLPNTDMDISNDLSHGNATVLGNMSNKEHKQGDIVRKVRSELSQIKFIEGRPMMGLMVSQNIQEAKKSAAFITCGHPNMVDDIRASVVKNIDNEDHKRVDYFEQLQVWA